MFLNPFKLFTRLAWLALLLFGGGTAALVTVAVLATGGLGSRDLVTLPGEPTRPGAPQPEVNLNDAVQKRPLLQNVPLPDEISTDPDVVKTNIGLAIVLAILFGIVSTALNNLIRDEEETFRRWLSVPVLKPLLRLFGWGAGRSVYSGCLTLPIILLIFALYGLIFAFLEEGLDVFSPGGMQLVLVMALSVGLISLAGDMARRQVAFFWRRTVRFGLYPANLLIAILTTAFSRGLALSPGIVFGAPGGVDIDMDDTPPFREVVLVLVTLALIAVLGGLGWAAAAAVRAVGDQTMGLDQADFAAPLAQLGLTIGLALFLVAVETSFFETVPVGSTLGGQLLRRNPLLWFLAFTPVTFVFCHVLLNPDSDYLQAFEQANVQVLSAVIAGMAALTAALWVYFRVLRRQAAPALPAAPSQVAPPRYAAPPPPSFGPPPGGMPAQSAPPTLTSRSGPHAHPPAGTGDSAPPPIVISDNTLPPASDRDKTRRHIPPGETVARTRLSSPDRPPELPTRPDRSTAPDETDEDDTLIIR